MSNITLLDSASDDVLRQHLYPEADTLTLVESASKLVAELATLATPEDVLNAQMLKADIERLRDEVESRRVTLKAPVLEFGRRLDAIAAAATGPLAVASQAIRSKLDEFNRKQEVARQEAEAAARAAQEAEGPGYAMPAITPELIAQATPAIKVPTRTSTTVVVTDPSLVPAKFWIIDQAAVKKAALAGEAIPGVEVRREKKAT
jgi:16S rRNA A1518/A1519 N6-dimethyltransferase RsmA/KsgA/DIM1 with predicted DNA glycosylase/AP lyase activity